MIGPTPDDPERVLRALYIPPLASIVVGTNLGRVMIYDLKGDCLFTLASDFSLPISCLMFNSDKQALLAAGKEGHVGLWKLPADWWHYKEGE